MTTTNKHIPIITIDGPSGTGKGTLAKMLARYLDWHFLDSGALYRILALAAMNAQINLTEEASLVKLAQQLDLSFTIQEDDHCVFLDNKDVTEAIRTEECSQNASIVAAIPSIRAALLERQRAFAKWPGLVTDGRDMGTIVFPGADLKIYLHASAEERAKRRYFQLKELQNDVSLPQVVEELTKRDARDIARASSPLRPADDAVKIDTTRLTILQVFDNVLQLANERLHKFS